MNTSSLNRVYSRGLRQENPEFLRSYHAEESRRRAEQRHEDRLRADRQREDRERVAYDMERRRADRLRQAEDRRADDIAEARAQQRRAQADDDFGAWLRERRMSLPWGSISRLRADLVFSILR